MTNNRAAIFDDDLSDFAPKAPAPEAASPEAVRQVAERGAFRSREPKPALPTPASATPIATPAPAPVSTAPPRREMRRYRTGRNVQLNLKVRQEAADAFYALADDAGLVLGEVFERAVEALRREIAKG